MYVVQEQTTIVSTVEVEVVLWGGYVTDVPCFVPNSACAKTKVYGGGVYNSPIGKNLTYDWHGSWLENDVWRKIGHNVEPSEGGKELACICENDCG